MFIWLHYCVDYNVFVVISRYDDITAVDFLAVQVGVAFDVDVFVIDCLQADPTLRQQWDDYTSKMEVVDFDDVSHSEVLYWEVKLPVS